MQKWKSLVQAAKYQIYISRSRDPFLNLSIEHYLLQKSSAESTILFLYINKPCIVIGRNQNPWLEVNLDLIRQSRSSANTSPVRNVELVRRRSGGGTVFHDEGNVNYSVICPPANFTRDKHAEMVTRALRKHTGRARVNERHDIVLDTGAPLEQKSTPAESDMHRTKFHSHSPTQPGPLKISGSAYKMIRNRSLHHGTCLIASPNLTSIKHYLTSPARPFMKARGVESVRSKIGNVFEPAQEVVGTKGMTWEFQRDVIRAFADMHSIDNEDFLQPFTRESAKSSSVWSRDDRSAGYVGEEMTEVEELANGMEELKSPKWLYGQTPQFTLSSHSFEGDDRERPSLPEGFASTARVYLKARGGSITETNISTSYDADASARESPSFDQALNGKNIHEIRDFREGLPDGSGNQGMMKWLNSMFGKLQ